ncbi:TetR/AcrR family transcriptional regulator [Lolliginicoccus levis]|uniref:TetR/AcrR family transcriptional regulator n=1 Tax=Lolliginicoccus levis TaxID=2919542 RepID=UPI00241F899F|nr:TetR/AcrR family transcriptional regulator [Lolliginicoccus levis]
MPESRHRTRARARPGEGAQLRDDILDAAEAMLVESGTESALTMRAVASRTGVTTPSVYLHFENKETLVDAVCLRVWDQLGIHVRESGARHRDPFTALAAQARAFTHFALDHPVQYRVLMMRQSSSPGVALAARECYKFHLETVSQCIETGIFQGSPQRLAIGLWSALHGYVSLLISQPDFPWPVDIEVILLDTIRMAGFGTAIASRLPERLHLPEADLPERLDRAAEEIVR